MDAIELRGLVTIDAIEPCGLVTMDAIELCGLLSLIFVAGWYCDWQISRVLDRLKEHANHESEREISSAD